MFTQLGDVKFQPERCALGTSGLWDKCLVYEIIHQSLRVCACTSLHVLVEVRILTYPCEQIRHTSPFMLSGNFSQGTLILSSSCFSTEVCCKSPLSQLSTCTEGNRKHLKMRGSTTQQTTKSLLKRWYRQVFATSGISYSSRHSVGFVTLYCCMMSSSGPWNVTCLSRMLPF